MEKVHIHKDSVHSILNSQTDRQVREWIDNASTESPTDGATDDLHNAVITHEKFDELTILAAIHQDQMASPQ